MLTRLLACTALLFFSACADDVGYHQSNYKSQPESVAGYYSPVGYSAPYVPARPVYGTPYLYGPVMGGIYVRGDASDDYGGPIFSPHYGIQCDRRRLVCWSRNGPEYGWSTRFFGRRHAYWQNKDSRDTDWGHGHALPGGGGNPTHGPWIYQVPTEPDGSGAPTFYSNGCGGNGQPPC